jgi:DNA gyrase subunit A
MPVDGNGPAGSELVEPVQPIEIQEEMERSFLEYAMSVIVSRALPDVRDGLKPVHRRILYGMYDMGLRPDRPHVKCASVTGAVMGRFHPHGNQAIYDALARMAQWFSLRHPLIDGHGNFGTVDDPPAAERYTECRMGTLALELMDGLDEDTVDLVPNYSGSETEPVVLPGRFPNLLVNGSQGIAVGMATNIPPHNLGEVIDAVVALIDNPQATAEQLAQVVRGPDFPTGGLILGREGILDAYRTGKGAVRIRAKTEIDWESRGGPNIVITEMPFQASIDALEQRIDELVRSGQLDGIRNARDDSAGGRTRFIIECKRDADPRVILNNLYKLTNIQTTFNVNMLALVDGVPRTLDLRSVLSAYLDHQIVVVRRRSEFRLEKARARAHIVEGLLRAIDQLDAVIAVIRGSADRDEARRHLMVSPFDLSEIQANHVLDMTLGRLTRLGRAELEGELAELRERIAHLEAILSDESVLLQTIRGEILAIRNRFATDRKTEIVRDPGQVETEDLVQNEDIVVTLTKAGYIKAVLGNSFRTQARGGRGIQGAKTREDDLISEIVHASTLSYLLLFSNQGRVFRLRGFDIPVRDRTARGVPAINLVPLAEGECVQSIVAASGFDPDRFLVFTTKRGYVKKTCLNEYDKARREGFIAVGLRDSDELVRVIETTSGGDLLLATSAGMIIRFQEQEVRPMGRAAAGVIGVRLRDSDHLVGADILTEERDLLLVTAHGYAKRTRTANFNAQGRGGQGVRGMKVTPARGEVVGALVVDDTDEIMLVSSSGVTIKLAAREIARQGRDATGVRAMNLVEGQSVVSIARVAGGSGTE